VADAVSVTVNLLFSEFGSALMNSSKLVCLIEMASLLVHNRVKPQRRKVLLEVKRGRRIADGMLRILLIVSDVRSIPCYVSGRIEPPKREQTTSTRAEAT
jgi:hypothetical protein